MRLWFFSGLIAIVLGFGLFNGISSLEPAFLIVGMVTLAGAAINFIGVTKDYLNPLSFLIFSAYIRIGLPALLSFWYEPPSSLTWSSIPLTYWVLGRNLALIGLLAVVVGWCFVPRGLIQRVECLTASLGQRFVIDQQVARTASCFIICGFIFVIIFLRLNFASAAFDAITTGIIRGSDHRVANTSRYSFLSYWLLMSGAATLSCYLIYVRRSRWWLGVLPGLFALLVLSPFGQRVGAMTALVYGLIFLWYRDDNAKTGLRPRLGALSVVACLFLVYAGFMLQYRGAGITSGLEVLSWDGIRQYGAYTIWVELGTLHPFALATVFEPGVLHGQTYPLIGGYVNEMFLGLSGIRPGAFIVEQLIDPAGGWGFHTGLIVDVYMNSGLAATLIACAIFGAVLRLVYAGFINHRDNAGVVLGYVIISWNMLWIFYESIINIFPLLTALLFFVLLFLSAIIVPTYYHGSAHQPLVSQR